jgi:hypothetical protein
MIRQVAEYVAVLACALFAGASIYINLVEHPARIECGTELAATVFAPSYRRATITQVSLAALAFIGSIIAWRAGARIWWALAGAILIMVIPFTLIVIMPTNKKLLNPQLDRRSQTAAQLLLRWSNLHAVRSLLSGLALLIFLYLLVFQPAAI